MSSGMATMAAGKATSQNRPGRRIAERERCGCPAGARVSGRSRSRFSQLWMNAVAGGAGNAASGELMKSGSSACGFQIHRLGLAGRCGRKALQHHNTHTHK